MIPEKLFQQLLVLGDAWRVKAVDYVKQQSKVVIRIEETPQLWSHQKCPHCEAASVAGYDHAPGILAHWQQGLTTAFLEGLNSLFSATKRKARGYRSSEYQIAMLYFVAGKLEIPHY